MSETTTLEVTTHVFGMGTEHKTSPVFVVLDQHTTTARALIAEHVRAEMARAQQARTSSLALHYLLSDNVRVTPTSTTFSLDVDAEIARAYTSLVERRYMLVVDGIAVNDPDAPLTLTDRSNVSFVRLLPLIGG